MCINSRNKGIKLFYLLIGKEFLLEKNNCKYGRNVKEIRKKSHKFRKKSFGGGLYLVSYICTENKSKHIFLPYLSQRTMKQYNFSE
jgi:hypothetical protein